MASPFDFAGAPGAVYLSGLILLFALFLLPAHAQPASATAITGVRTKAPEGPSWSKLSPAQRTTLKPLERDWSEIDASGKQKWLELAARFPRMPVPDQVRMQERMVKWAKLTPKERGQVRLHYQEAKQVAPQDRQARWEAYQALPPDRRLQLAARAAPVASASVSEPFRRAPIQRNGRLDKAGRESSQTPSNLVPNPAYAAPRKPVAPTVVQAQPGATTTLMSTRSTPPSHQHTGLTKIAATSEFINKTTLLPKKGAQAAATRSAAASSPPTAQ